VRERSPLVASLLRRRYLLPLEERRLFASLHRSQPARLAELALVLLGCSL
jgi:hypothetical protein